MKKMILSVVFLGVILGLGIGYRFYLNSRPLLTKEGQNFRELYQSLNQSKIDLAESKGLVEAREKAIAEQEQVLQTGKALAASGQAVLIDSVSYSQEQVNADLARRERDNKFLRQTVDSNKVYQGKLEDIIASLAERITKIRINFNEAEAIKAELAALADYQLLNLSEIKAAADEELPALLARVNGDFEEKLEQIKKSQRIDLFPDVLEEDFIATSSWLKQAAIYQAEQAEVKKRKEIEEQQRQQAEAEVKKKKEIEEQQRRQAEAEKQRKALEEEKLKQAEAEKQRKIAEEERRRQAEVESKKKAAEEQQRQQAEAERKRKQAEEEQRRAQFEADRKIIEAEKEQQRQAEAEIDKKIMEVEKEERRQAEIERQKKAAEEDQRQQAEAEKQKQIDAVIADWQAFWQELGVKADLSAVKIPEHAPEFNRILIIPQRLTLNQVIQFCKDCFPVSSYWEDWDGPNMKNDRLSTQTYAVCLRDWKEAEEELNNISTIVLVENKISGITLLERLVYELKYFNETGDHLDKITRTLCHGSRITTTNDSAVVCWQDGQLDVSWYDGYPNSLLRTRAVVY